MGLLHFSEAERVALIEAIDPQDPQVAPYWRSCHNHNLLVQWCGACDRHQWPPRPTCRWCLTPEPEWREVEARGVVFSWTEVHMTALPAFAARTPYSVVLAELAHADNVRVLATYEGSTQPQIGDAVRMTFVDVNDDISLPFWSPDEPLRQDNSGPSVSAFISTGSRP